MNLFKPLRTLLNSSRDPKVYTDTKCQAEIEGNGCKNDSIGSSIFPFDGMVQPYKTWALGFEYFTQCKHQT